MGIFGFGKKLKKLTKNPVFTASLLVGGPGVAATALAADEAVGGLTNAGPDLPDIPEPEPPPPPPPAPPPPPPLATEAEIEEGAATQRRRRRRRFGISQTLLVRDRLGQGGASVLVPGGLGRAQT